MPWLSLSDVLLGFSVLLVDKRELKVFSVFCFVRLNTVCNHALSNFLQRKKKKGRAFPFNSFYLIVFKTLLFYFDQSGEIKKSRQHESIGWCKIPSPRNTFFTFALLKFSSLKF